MTGAPLFRKLKRPIHYYRNIMHAPSILDLPGRIAQLNSGERARFERLFRVDVTHGGVVVPDSMRAWVIEHFGDLQAVEQQTIVRVTNLQTWDGAIYNPVRGRRPIPTRMPASAAHDYGADVFADPLRTTAEDRFGRVHGTHCITTGNIARGDGQHAVLIFDEFDPLKFTQAQVRDYIDTGWTWAQRAHAADPQARYYAWMWNGGVKAGASIPHAHAQLFLGRAMHYAKIESLRRAAINYRLRYGYNYFEDLYAVHQDIGLSFSCAGQCAFINIAAQRPKDIWIVCKGYDRDLADALNEALRRLIDQADMGAFNAGILMPPPWPAASVEEPEEWTDFPILARIVDRGYPDMLSSDIGALDMFAQQLISVDPYLVHQQLN